MVNVLCEIFLLWFLIAIKYYYFTVYILYIYNIMYGINENDDEIIGNILLLLYY